MPDVTKPDPWGPEDFELTILVEANRLRMLAIAESRSNSLDPKTSFWVARREAWIDLMRDARYGRMIVQSGLSRRKELFGLPVRVTVDDEPDVPLIQLVMEPMVRARR
jgi:hypothetical protein